MIKKVQILRNFLTVCNVLLNLQVLKTQDVCKLK
jgi:hypothetical protein